MQDLRSDRYKKFLYPADARRLFQQLAPLVTLIVSAYLQSDFI